MPSKPQPIQSLRHLSVIFLAGLAWVFFFGSASVSPELTAGDHVRTQSGLTLEIEGFVDDGKRGRVFKVKDSAGKHYALKVARMQSLRLWLCSHRSP